MENLSPSALSQYLTSDSLIDWCKGSIPTYPVSNYSPFMQANAYFFGHPKWARTYLETENCSDAFRERWRAALESWDDKVVVDIGCGPGNLYASVGGSPRVLIGVDISRGALEMAMQLGYTPLLADAQNLPLVSGFADIVTANAVLHHCDDMAKVLAEAARLVRPGGLLITDEDPQQTAWYQKGLGLLVQKTRLRLSTYWPMRSVEKATRRFATEAHNRQPGDGVTPELYYKTLEPLGFTFKLYPHNHDVGAELLQGDHGRSSWIYRLEQQLSGINPDSPEAASSVMCIATRSGRI